MGIFTVLLAILSPIAIWSSFAAVTFGVVCVLFVTFRRYASFRNTPWYVTAFTILGWFLSFGIVILLPMDMTMTYVARNGNDIPMGSLIMIWRILYWLTFALCWAVIPLLQGYVVAGEFSFFMKVRSAIISNAIFYVAAAAFVGVVILYLAIIGGFTRWLDISNLAMSLANAWGLSLLVGLLGYGLVDIPRRIFRRSNPKLQMRFCLFELAQLEESRNQAEGDLDDILHEIAQVDDSVSAGDPLRPRVLQILSLVPQLRPARVGPGRVLDVSSAASASALSPASTATRVSYAALAALHSRLKFAQHQVAANQRLWHATLEKSFDLQDRLSNATHPSSPFYISTIRKAPSDSQTGWQKTLLYLEWQWKCRWERVLLFLLGIACLLLSLVIAVSECVFWYLSPPLSPLYYVTVEAASLSSLLLEAVVLIPIGYMAICAYTSLFRLKLFSYYNLIPGGCSDSNSLLFSSAYICRLVAPMGYNYLNLVHETKYFDPPSLTAFSVVMGEMDMSSLASSLGVLGKYFNLFVPILIVIVMVITVFSLFSRLLSKLGFKKTMFVDSFHAEMVEKGQEILDKERRKREREFQEWHRSSGKEVSLRSISQGSSASAATEDERREYKDQEGERGKGLMNKNRGSVLHRASVLEEAETDDALLLPPPPRSATMADEEPHTASDSMLALPESDEAPRSPVIPMATLPELQEITTRFTASRQLERQKAQSKQEEEREKNQKEKSTINDSKADPRLQNLREKYRNR